MRYYSSSNADSSVPFVQRFSLFSLGRCWITKETGCNPVIQLSRCQTLPSPNSVLTAAFWWAYIFLNNTTRYVRYPNLLQKLFTYSRDLHSRTPSCSQRNTYTFGTSASNINRLQRLQNSAARLVTRQARRDSAMSLLRELHWLPVRHRVTYKIAELTFKALHVDLSPTYLQQCVQV